MKMLQNGTRPLAKQMKDFMYVNDIKPHRGKFINTSTSKKGRES